MTCKICGKKLPDGSTVCKYCGTELRRPQSKSKRYSKKGKARKHAMDAVVLLLALLVIAGVIAAIAWSSDKAAGETEEPATVTEETQPSEEHEIEIVEEEETEAEEEKEEPVIQIVGEETEEEEEELPETLTGTQAPEETPEEPEEEEAPAPQTPSGTYTVSINRTEVTASMNKYRELILTVNETLPAGVTVKDITWTAADPSIVRTETVDGVGRAWGVKVGTTTVTGVLTLSDGQSFTKTCEVSVVEKQEQTPTPSNGYILAESSTRLYTTSELSGLSATQLWYARNEIFARHGRKFDNPELQAYFNSQSWYKGTINAADFDYFSLSTTERKNIDTIEAVEATK